MKKFIFFLMLITSMDLWYAYGMHKVLKIGHRGACAIAPENTISAFEKALEAGVDMVELDVFVCKSGEVIVFHDDTIDRMTNGEGLVIEKTLVELKALKVKGNELIYTLCEILNFLNKRVQVLVELKGEGVEEPVANIITEYIAKKDWRPEHFVFMALDHWKLQKIRQCIPSIRIAPCLIGIPLELAAWAECMKADIVVTGADTVSEAYVNDAHQRGIKMFVPGRDNEMIKKMLSLGVDGIIADDPNLILRD